MILKNILKAISFFVVFSGSFVLSSTLEEDCKSIKKYNNSVICEVENGTGISVLVLYL